jgi:hypothetical protein
MARVVLVIDSSDQTIGQLNGKLMDGADGHEAVKKLINYFKGVVGGTEKDITLEITTRDNDVVVSTSGSGSKQETHNI